MPTCVAQIVSSSSSAASWKQTLPYSAAVGTRPIASLIAIGVNFSPSVLVVALTTSPSSRKRVISSSGSQTAT